MDNNYRFQFITEYTTPRGDFHQLLFSLYMSRRYYGQKTTCR